MAKYALVALVLGILLSSPLLAGEYNETLDIGDKAPVWADLPGVDGKKHALADLKEKEIVVLAFTCNSCPVAVAYEDRLIAFTKKYAGPSAKVAVVAVNVNTIPQDRLPKMKERARNKGYNFPYLYDETQKIARAYGASTTPEVFVLNSERKVVYMGAMDDKIKPADVKAKYLEAAVEAALRGGKPKVMETLPRGCLIRYARKRK
jgi:peroxiredoxin